ncbi:MAG: topoisomerase C-terminal repeat-containing protein, partial [Pseudomonadota bacterium]
LVKRMEELGIGRPSTYASIISVIQDRDYVRKEKNRLHAEDKGVLVTAFLENFFRRYVEYDFTASLEESLDDVSGGREDWRELLRRFWLDFNKTVDDTSALRNAEVIDRVNEAIADHVFPPRGDGRPPRLCPLCDVGQLSLKPGRYGAFIGCSNYPDCRYTRQLGAPEGPAEAGSPDGKTLGQDADGVDILLKIGPYGPYVQRDQAEEGKKPKRTSVPKNVAAETVDLDYALKLLSLPREIGPHPDDGVTITAGLGRFGPFVKHGPTYANLSDPADLFEIGLNRAVVLIAEKKAKSGRGAAAKPLKTLGEHPDGGPVELFEGRYGPYVKHGKVNATVPKEEDAGALSLERALELIAAKAPKKKAPARKTGAKAAGAAKTRAKAAGDGAEGAAAASKPAPRKRASKKAAAPPRAEAEGGADETAAE